MMTPYCAQHRSRKQSRAADGPGRLIMVAALVPAPVRVVIAQVNIDVHGRLAPPSPGKRIAWL
jgi:hypothetical protein